jgi:UDP-N-acetylglucosamine:LPS N-acetylglucosamine transferase
MTEMFQLMDAFKGHDIFFITYEGVRSDEISPKYIVESLGDDLFKHFKAMPGIIKILRKEKPDVVISTGPEIAVPVFYAARLLGIKTIYIESLCRIKDPSITGKLIYPIASVFLVQSKELLNKYGKKAQYWGNVL